MKILWLSHIVPYPPKGGVLQRSYHLLHELAQRNEVHLVSFVQREPLLRMYGDVEHGLNECRRALKALCPIVRLVPIPSEQARWGKQRLLLSSLLGRYPYSVNWLKSRAMRAELASLLAEVRYDAVHFDTISLAVYRDMFPDIKCVLNHHNIESHMMLRRGSNEKNWLAKAYLYYEGVRLKNYERAVCRRFDAHTTCSDLDSKRLLAIDDALRTAVIPNGVDIDYFKSSGAPREPLTLVFAGRYSAYPNRRALLFLVEEVWPLLQQELPEIRIDIVGADPPPAAVELGRRDPRFRVHGFVDDVRPYLDSAGVYICPIQDGGGTKLKVLDALAMGIPLVADPIACEGIDVVPDETVLHASSPSEYVIQIKRLLGDAALRHRMSIGARRLIEQKYSYASIGSQLQALYENLAGQRGGVDVSAQAKARVVGVSP